MPSTYSPDLRIELIANGEQSGTWGTTTNNNLGTLIEDAISGMASVTTATANQALTAQNGAVDQARCAAIQLDTLAGTAFNVYVPPVTKLYVIENLSAYTATVYCSTVLGNTTAAGTGVAIPAGASVLLRSDSVNVVEQLNHVSGPLTTPTAAPGTNTTQVATTAFVTAAISAAGGGNVTGPASSTDNALARFDGTTGKVVQNSVGILTDAGALSGVTMNANVITAGTLSDSRLSSNVALLTGAQTFTGSKTFTGGLISTDFNFNATSAIYLSGSAVNVDISSVGMTRTSAASFNPAGDNNKTLGTAALRWSVVYAGTGTINTSDANTKQDIADLDDAERRVAVRIKGLIKKFRFKDAVAEKGNAARIHVGVIAQEVRDSFTAEGLDPNRYSLFCSDTWWEREEEITVNGTTRTETIIHKAPVEGATEVTRLGVRYDELLAFVIAAL